MTLQVATIGRRFYVEAALAPLFALTAGLLLWRRDWIEALTGLDPDHGAGLAEWILVLVLGASAVVLSGLAQREWARTASARTATPVKGRA